MTTTAEPPARPATWTASRPAVHAVTGPAVDVVIPVYNEQADLERSVLRLYAHLQSSFPYTFRITIADNASTDATWPIACRLADAIPRVTAVRLEEKGRGRALNRVWSDSDATVLAYMDVDLSTDLSALLPLVAPLLSGHSDLAIGTRLARGSRVVRGPKRELISRSYNLLLRTTLATRFSDAQCGFKAIRADRARSLLPLVEDTGWFFDTELLVLAERAGLRIHEVPVDWVDDPDSRVDIVATATDDIKGIWRLGRGLASGRIPLASLRDRARTEQTVPTPPGMVTQLFRFAAIGVVSTLAYVAIYLLLRGAVSAQWANALALVLTTVANTAANRRLTFQVTGPDGRVTAQVQGFVVFGIGLLLTSGALALLHAAAPDAARAVEVAVLVVASVGATVVRFLLFRSWVFRRSAGARPPARGTSVPAAPSPARSVPSPATSSVPSVRPERAMP